MNARFDPATPNTARVYDYWLGGKDHFPADRAEAERLLGIYPPLRDLARENRAFVIQAVSWAARQGISQFIDLGAGLPASPAVHQAARTVLPAARVAYVDIDPVVLSHARALLATGDGVIAVAADLRDPGAMLPQIAHELAADLDKRRRELGERLVAKPEPWLTRHLGVLPPDASPALREDYVQRAGTAAAYREARGITDPQQAVSLGPHPEPELSAMQRDTFRALEIADEQAEIRAASRGALEARVLEGERAQATAPPDVSGRLRLTAQAEADAWQQSAAAETEHDPVRAYNARALANRMAADKARLEAASARYEQWSATTAATREAAGKAKAELQRREHEPGPAETEILGPEADHDGGRAARLGQLQARANEAAARIEAERAELDASNGYTTRIEREAQAEPEADRQAEALAEIEMELQ